MSHVAEVYAKDLGVKIGKAQLTDHFYPICTDKYIVANLDNELQVNQYDYWDVVISLIGPHLEKEKISIVQISDKDVISLNQKNHIIKNSQLFFGVLTHFSQVASIYDVPSVSLLSNVYPENRKPSSKSVVLTPDFSKIKPSFSITEQNKRINEIKPEEIAQSILNELGIKEKIKFKTIRCGKKYSIESVEIIPDFFGFSQKLKDKPINLRGDLHFDLANIMQWCQLSLVNLIIDQPIPYELVNGLKGRIKQMIFKIDDLKEDYSEFFDFVKKAKINLILFTENKDIISDLRIKYFDFPVFLENLEKDIESLVNENTKYMSKKQFISNASVYFSHSSQKALDKSNKFHFNKDSLREIESLYLYE